MILLPPFGGVCVVSHGITGASTHVGISGLEVPVGAVRTCRSWTGQPDKKCNGLGRISVSHWCSRICEEYTPTGGPLRSKTGLELE